MQQKPQSRKPPCPIEMHEPLKEIQRRIRDAQTLDEMLRWWRVAIDHPAMKIAER